MNWIAKRSGEPSSWGGIAAIVLGAIFGADNPIGSPEFGAAVVGVIAGIIAFVKGEKGNA